MRSPLFPSNLNISFWKIPPRLSGSWVSSHLNANWGQLALEASSFLSQNSCYISEHLEWISLPLYSISTVLAQYSSISTVLALYPISNSVSSIIDTRKLKCGIIKFELEKRLLRGYRAFLTPQKECLGIKSSMNMIWLVMAQYLHSVALVKLLTFTRIFLSGEWNFLPLP